MNTHPFSPARHVKHVLLLLLLGYSGALMAQAPTSLKYPTPNVFITNVSNVYLAPTVSGNVTSYSISPALPAGLDLDTNTGIIYGMPTAASPNTVYTITATGGSPSGSTSTTVAIQNTSNFFNNNFNSIGFLAANQVNKVGTGTAAGNIVLFQNVANLSGQAIDCIVKTVSVTNATFTAYDQAAASGTGYSSNADAFFSPQLNLSAAGSVTFNFQFILGGSYNNTTNTGLPVVLQNVHINTYDIDGNASSSQNGSFQYNEFGGFDSSALGSPTRIVPTYNAATGLTNFRSNNSINLSAVTDPSTRIRVSYTNISDFTIVVGADASGAAYFFLDFSSGPAFATAQTTAAPSIDLNTGLIGVNNPANGCGASIGLTPASAQNNIVSPTGLNQFSLRFPSADIKDGASEQLQIDGATSGGTMALNFTNGAAIPNVVLGATTYKVTAAVASGVSTLTFTNNAGGTLSVAQTEALLDALRYNNAAAAPTNGDRRFTVNVRNSTFQSPDAIFTASLNCVSISGNIFHDVNGLTDGTVNQSGTPLPAGFAWAVRVNALADTVIDVKPINASGAYNFGTVTAGKYGLFVSNSQPATGSVFTAATYPSGTSGAYKSTGEHFGSGSGNDLLTDGKLLITVGSSSVSDANFGIQLPPVTNSQVLMSVANPGGFNAYILPVSSFSTSDEDGSISSITITAFPTGANYLKVGSTVYTTAGSTCPPQSACTAWPGSVSIPFAAGFPSQVVTVDPAMEGNTTVSISFTALDNGGLSSNASTTSINFTGASYYSIGGMVWHDANGNGLQNGTESLTQAAGPSESLYALLVQLSNTYSGAPTILKSAPVSNATGYSFTGVPAGNNYEVRITSRAAAPVDGDALSAVTLQLAPGWTAVSTNNNGTLATGLHTATPSISLPALSGNKANINFGIEQIPVADAKNLTASYLAFTSEPSVRINGLPSFSIVSNSGSINGASPASLSGSDAEDCAAASGCHTGKTFIIQSVRPNTRLFYDFGAGAQEVTAVSNNVLSNFDPSKLTIYGQHLQGQYDSTALGFTYSLVDAAAVPSAPATYTLKSLGAPLPVSLLSFSGQLSGCSASLQWETASEANSRHFELQQSADGRNFRTVATIAAQNKATGARYEAAASGLAAKNWFRLNMVDHSGQQAYSHVLMLNAAGCEAPAIRVWPNPVAAELNISQAAGASLRLYDATGRLVLQQQALQADARVDMSRLAPGLYQLQLSGPDGSLLHSARIVRP